MAEIVRIGKKATIIEGTEAEINEIRQKLHELGFNFDNYQYIELKEKDPTTLSPSTNPVQKSAVSNQAPVSQTAKVSNPAQVSQTAKVSNPAPVSQTAKVSNPAPVTQQSKPAKPTEAPQKSTQAIQSDSSSEYGVPYKITQTQDGFSVLIPQSKLDKIVSQFLVKNVQRKRITKQDPEIKGTNYFFTLNQPNVDIKVYPPQADEQRVVKTALKLLSLI